MHKLKTFCCGCSLRCGSVVVILTVFPFLVVLLFGVINSVVHPKTDSSDEDDLDDFANVDDDLIEAFAFSVYASAVALYGIYKEKPKKLVNYLRIHAACLVLILITIVFLIKMPHKILHLINLDKRFRLPLIFTLVFLFGLFSYFYAVVYSYHRELKNSIPKDELSPAGVPLRIV